MREDKIFSFLNFLASYPVLTLICIIFFIGDTVLATCIIYNRIHRNEIMEYRSRYDEAMKSRDKLGDLLEEAQNSYRQMSEKLNRMDGMYRDLQKQSRAAQSGSDSKISSLTTDLHSCQNTNLGFITRITEKDSTIGALKNKENENEQISEGLKKLFVRQLALGPTWIEAGESFTSPDGDFIIKVGKPSGMDRCLKGSTAVVRLFSGNDKKTLCVGPDRTESFKHGGKWYILGLLGVGENEKGPEYLVSIVKK